MKKFTLFFVFALMLTSSTVFGQARSELNFGLIGVNYEIPVLYIEKGEILLNDNEDSLVFKLLFL